MTDNLLDPKYPPHKTVEQMEAEMRGNLAKHDRLAMIARKHLNLETLETRNSDSADFSDQAVWNIRAALAAAYEAGKREAPESPAEWIMRQPDGTQTKVTVEKIVAQAVVAPAPRVINYHGDPYLP